MEISRGSRIRTEFSTGK